MNATVDEFVVTILPEVVFSRKRTGIDLSSEFAADGLQPLHVPGPRYFRGGVGKVDKKRQSMGWGWLGDQLMISCNSDTYFLVCVCGCIIVYPKTLLGKKGFSFGDVPRTSKPPTAL